MKRPDPRRFDLTGKGRTMMAVVTTANGGYDRLVYRRVPVPRPGPGEVLVRVLAAGINNTEINTRIGWYSDSVTTATADAASGEERQAVAKADGGWDRPTPFPFIQGTDCCGIVDEAGPDTDARNIMGRRVLVRPCMRTAGFGSLDTVWMASDFDGAFADYVVVPATEVFAIDSTWSDAQLATLPCAYGTSENMLHRAAVGPGDVVLVTGASGGVGSATVQLARRRGAHVIAMAAASKGADVMAAGAHRVLDRGDDPAAVLGQESVTVVIDNVAGPGFPRLLKALRRGGRYASSGAIAGPMVALDMRDFYLKDLRLIGCTAWDAPVFPDLVGYVERNEIRPLLAGTYPLSDIVRAQKDFLEKRHVGKLVLIPAGGMACPD